MAVTRFNSVFRPQYSAAESNSGRPVLFLSTLVVDWYFLTRSCKPGQRYFARILDRHLGWFSATSTNASTVRIHPSSSRDTHFQPNTQHVLEHGERPAVFSLDAMRFTLHYEGIRDVSDTFIVERTMSKPVSLLQGTLDLLVLSILNLEPKTGWAISSRLRQMSNETLQVSHGSLYPALHKLEAEGWIRGEWQESSETGRRVKCYSLTPAGRKQLRSEAENWVRLSTAVNAIVEPL